MAFGDLLRKLWAPGATPVAPRVFKSKLARFSPQFSGFNQHDSQVSKVSCLLNLFQYSEFYEVYSFLFYLNLVILIVIGAPGIFVGRTA